MGDYLDSFDKTNEEIMNNFLDIIQFKEDNMDKVILLLGNHEWNYWPFKPHESNPYHCSGYRGDAHWDLWYTMQKNKHLFQLAYQYKDHIFTHAGIHIGWWNYRALPEIMEIGLDTDNYSIADKLNGLYLNNKQSIHDCGYGRGGSRQVGGPLWADKSETCSKPLEGYHQIVGHSKVKDIVRYCNFKDKNTSITFIDTESKDFLMIEL